MHDNRRPGIRWKMERLQPEGSSSATPSEIERALVPSVDEQRLVAQALPLLEEVARRIRWQLGGKVELDDLLSAGHLALAELVRRYDPQRAPFAAYMRARLRWAILDSVRRDTHGRALTARAGALAASAQLSEQRSEEQRAQALPPSERTYAERLKTVLREHATAMGIKLLAAQGTEVATAPSSAQPDRAAIRRVLCEQLRGVVAELADERQRALVLRHYFQGEALADIAADLGLSKSWASRLHARAIAALNERLRGGALDPGAR